MTTPETTPDLPVIVIGAGPVGLAAAAHLLERNVTPLVVEVGDHIAASIRAWGHTRLFSPWKYNIDDAARRLLETTNWDAPDPDALPTGQQFIDQYLTPLADALGDRVRMVARVVAVSREGIDKSRSLNRAETPLLVRIVAADGTEEDLAAHAVLDASGTWDQPNPLGRSGLTAPGELAAQAQGRITAPLPDVLGTDRHRFTNRRVLVVGSGHSAANTLLELAELAADEPDTQILWAIRSADPSTTVAFVGRGLELCSDN
ncbi:MAG: NAD(P)-binding domain-containing protein, partial [Yaniella sp.]|uniref:NAD(P)-binding domain-containing protein n=1 Tax=Yaniella sp. TaxID=2773929 RepID=UPI003F977785